MQIKKASNTPQFNVNEIKSAVTVEMVLDYPDYESNSSGEWHSKMCCPLHEESVASFNFGNEMFQCFSCKAKGDIFDLYMKLNNVEFPVALQALGEMAKTNDIQPSADIFYEYQDEHGQLIFRKVKKFPKKFHWERFNNGNWSVGCAGQKPPLYKLPELIVDPTRALFLVEGEKDVHTVSGSLGLLATTPGAVSWLTDYTQYCAGRHVFILPDNDAPGRSKANQIALAIREVATEVKIVNLPNLKDKQDVSDWVAAGGTREQLLQLAADTDVYEPERLMLDGWTLLEHAKNRPPVIEVLSNICWAGESTLFFAREKTGKTTFLISAVANALKKGLKIMWYAGRGESSIHDVVSRLADLGCDINKENKLFFGNELRGDDFKEFAADMEYFHPDAVVIDSLNSCTVDLDGKAPDSSDDSGWAEAMGRFTSLLSGTSTGLLFIHHTKKESYGSYRGSAVIGAQVDNLIFMAGGVNREYTTLKSVLRTRNLPDMQYTYDIFEDRYKSSGVVISTFEQDLWLYDYLKNSVIPDDKKTANTIYAAAKLERYTRPAIRATAKRLGIDKSGGRRNCWQITDKTETIITEMQEKHEKIKEVMKKKMIDNLPATDTDENKQF